MNIGSKLTVAKRVVTSKAGRQLLKAQKNSPTILFGAGVVGVVATAISASKATLKLDDVLEEHENKQLRAQELLETRNANYSASDYAKDMGVLKMRLVTKVGKLYAPSVVIGTVSICALTGSHVILSRRNAGLMAAYAALDKGFNEYRARVLEHVGPEKERELRYGSETREVAVDTERGTEVATITTGTGGSPYAKLFGPETSQSWSPDPGYNLITLRAHQQYANDILHAKGHIFLNEVYDMLGLDRSPAGQMVGWVKDNGDNYVDFGIFTEENQMQFADFMTGREGCIWLDFNVDGVVYNLI